MSSEELHSAKEGERKAKRYDVSNRRSKRSMKKGKRGMAMHEGSDHDAMLGRIVSSGSTVNGICMVPICLSSHRGVAA